jgi:hypothetical protein
MGHEEEQPALIPEMAAWRAACAPRFAALLDHAFAHLHRYYRMQEPDPLRPLAEAGVRHALDQLFDPARYPGGMTPQAVLQAADRELVGHFEHFFAPHRDGMVVETKHHRRGGNSAGFNDVDRTVALYSEYFIAAMREALPEAALPVPRAPAPDATHVRRLAERYGAPNGPVR